MTGKKITFGSRPNKPNSDVDAWVESRFHNEYQKDKEKMKRLTIDVPESLHKLIKSACAMRGTKIADEVRELLYQKYGDL
ncbi:MAG TPA: plasmid partition protein ParG [Arsenophonus apicola]|uniref:plasmid partition protein ParG n=1 Tax=Arsenophonus apicola TaxID=2879119 RepID=UPI001CDCD0D3|nr:plasmid partition protein ParG [Arsenophonus apicola]UBX30757.1 hypothetical protein LDL57_16475 [Arsenophonus apicola]